MQPVLRIVLPIVGLLIAASLGSPANRALDCVLGALLGFVIADVLVLRASVEALSQDVGKLLKELRRRQNPPADSAPAASTEDAPEAVVPSGLQSPAVEPTGKSPPS